MTEKLQQPKNAYSIIQTLLCEPTDEESVQIEGMGKQKPHQDYNLRNLQNCQNDDIVIRKWILLLV